MSKGVDSCDDELVKSFIPSLFDSDSDTEDGYYLPSAGPPSCANKLPKISTLSNSHAESFVGSGQAPEASSPSSQGTSSLTAFQSSALTDPSSNLDDNAGFQSVLSVDSSTSTFDFDFCIDEERPAKRVKLEWGQAIQRQRISDPARKPVQEQAGVPAKAASQLPDVGPPQKLAGHSPQPIVQGAHHFAAAVDDHGREPTSRTLPIALHGAHPSAAPTAAGPAPGAWNPYQAPEPAQGALPAAPGPWPAPQGMIPTAPQGMIPTAPMVFMALTTSTVQPHVAPLSANSPEKISAALAELGPAVSVRPPLGLKLDKASVLQQLKGLGMAVAKK